MQEQTVHLVSWTIGLLDQLFRVLNFVLGPARPKFFSKGVGDLEAHYEQQATFLTELANPGSKDKFQLQKDDISWTTQSQDATVKIEQGRFLSPLADLLPEESKYAQFVLVEPTQNHHANNDNNSKKGEHVYVIMLPATGEMGKGTRLALARTLAKEHGWSSIILTAAYYGRRRPSGQKLFFINTVRDLLVQAQSLSQEGAMLATYFQSKHEQQNDSTTPNNKVCVTGFSFGAAMAANACALATRMGADGNRLACAAYVGCTSPVVLTGGVLQTSIDWKALQRRTESNDEKNNEATTRQWLHDEFNATQLAMLTTGMKTGNNPIAVVRGMSMKHDAFIPPRYALELPKQLLTAMAPANPPVWEWLSGGHVFAALLRPVYHKRSILSNVLELPLKDPEASMQRCSEDVLTCKVGEPKIPILSGSQKYDHDGREVPTECRRRLYQVKPFRRSLTKVLVALLALDHLMGDPVFAWSIFGQRTRCKRVQFSAGTLQDDRAIHEHFMRMALQEARTAANRNEVPIGAVIVRNITNETINAANHPNSKHHKQVFEILSTGRNKVEGEWDASAHAELVALRQAAKRIQNWRLLNCTLYSTVEPCPMCLSACQAFRLSRLVCGAPDLRLGAIETHMRLLDVVHPFHNVSVIEMGVLKDDCADIMRSFFRARRQQSNSVETDLNLRKWFGCIWCRLRNRLLRHRQSP